MLLDDPPRRVVEVLADVLGRAVGGERLVGEFDGPPVQAVVPVLGDGEGRAAADGDGLSLDEPAPGVAREPQVRGARRRAGVERGLAQVAVGLVGEGGGVDRVDLVRGREDPRLGLDAAGVAAVAVVVGLEARPVAQGVERPLTLAGAAVGPAARAAGAALLDGVGSMSTACS